MRPVGERIPHLSNPYITPTLPRIFPRNFVWGAATSAYQIEGAANAGGRGPSIWDDFCRRPGAILDKTSGQEASRHYRYWEEDVELMAELGLQAYRFSIAWPRVLPRGTGKVNAIGLDFYDRLVDALLARGIVPWLTLFHWDMPSRLWRQGGWAAPDMPAWFADYAAIVAARLGDRVMHWMTLNEPQVFVHMGHVTGENAPGVKLSPASLAKVISGIWQSHALAYDSLRASGGMNRQIGVALVGRTRVPDRRRDLSAARMATFDARGRDVWSNAFWADPMVLGSIPAEALQDFPTRASDLLASTAPSAARPLDFLGLNTYSADRVRQAPGGYQIVDHPPGILRTTMDWPVVPECLYYATKFNHERYGLPVVITESGMSNVDAPASDGVVHDPQRIEYLNAHLGFLARAVAEGCPVEGYFYWSLLDNFEWAYGLSRRFGLIYVDYRTGRRTLKTSAKWFREVIEQNSRQRKGGKILR